MIDILAEKNYKGKKEMNEIKRNKESKYPLYKSYIRASLIAEKLVSAGIAKGVLQQAIYSIIKHKFSEIEDRLIPVKGYNFLQILGLLSLTIFRDSSFLFSSKQHRYLQYKAWEYLQNPRQLKF
ncbi:hypothetical protein [Vreelandella songnenensis]|uniref:hypothetical protein n=1 Tax=Vreelandella songnenensis TaxID=1176243 RepID=UPI0011B1E5FB|nr:hypothetical protein [Halomonas songnenensis]